MQFSSREESEPTLESKINQLYSEAIARQLKARTSVLAQIEAFEPGWITGGVHKEICHHLDGVITLVERGEANPELCAGGPRLILQTPPGIGKTLMSGVHLISHALGRHPEWQFIYVTYNHDKACEVGRDTRQRILDPRFSEIHPKCTIDTSAQAMDYLLTTRGGKVSFTGIGGGSLGKRAHILVIDDPFADSLEGRSELHQQKVLDFALSVARSRLHPFGAIVVIHQRWHVKDLIGRLLELSLQNTQGDQWTNCQYPMVASEECSWRKKGDSVHKERFSNEWCVRTQASLTEWIWSAMYQQNPTLDSGMLFKRAWFKLIPRNKFPDNLRWYISTDFAATEGRGDFSVTRPFAVDEDDNIYFIDPFWAQVNPDVAHKATFDLYQKNDAKGIFVEKGGLWNAAQGAYRREQQARSIYPRIITFNRTTNKAEHAAGLIAHMAAGKVYHADTKFARDVVIPQYMAFTGERGVNERDDIVDTDYLPFLSWTEVRRPGRKVELPVVDTTDPVTQQMYEAVTDRGRKSASARGAWTAADIGSLGDGDGEEEQSNLEEESDHGVLPRLF